ncbi:MAG: decarboxylating 6-phosphogluconate dehydrogenase, partial [Candidatus Sericytochromatia bacterium]|nr:decarboxylating 6-phosphogluconate dehydrogenase [Candidatus Sericytochromatia bacterium]
VDEMVKKLPEQKIVWLMVPSGDPVDQNIEELSKYLKSGDIIIDGGNSNWKDSQKRHAALKEKGISFIDCGTSGGVWGLKNGYCLMYGGDKSSGDIVEPIFKTLAPKNGYVYCGTSGAGHFVKMVHNGIEYGMMQSYAEGFEIIEKSPFNIDLHSVSKAWEQGSVIRSWLLELSTLALEKDSKLSHIKDYVQDSGEGRWTVEAAMEFNVPAHVITAALYNRFSSRQDESFAMKLISALRNQFGGHEMKEEANEKN